MQEQQTSIKAQGDIASDPALAVAAYKRKVMFSLFFCALAFLGLGAGGYWYFVASRHIATDNAYVAAEMAQITPFVDGTVKDIKVVDTQSVKAGDVLVVIDDIDAKLTLARATGLFDKAQADVERANIDLARRKALVSSGSISAEELSTAENAYHAAKAAYDTAKAARDQAQVDLDRTIIKSPVDGIVAKREVELGQRVHAGTPLMAVVPVANTYVNANFRETQLARVKTGQAVELFSDLYGSDVVYHGHVEGLAGGTGSVFSLIPAQNATGNWIKVVQRLPVRIALDPAELAKNPLQVGLSMTADIDTGSR